MSIPQTTRGDKTPPPSLFFGARQSLAKSDPAIHERGASGSSSAQWVSIKCMPSNRLVFGERAGCKAPVDRNAVVTCARTLPWIVCGKQLSSSLLRCRDRLETLRGHERRCDAPSGLCADPSRVPGEYDPGVTALRVDAIARLPVIASSCFYPAPAPRPDDARRRSAATGNEMVIGLPWVRH